MSDALQERPSSAGGTGGAQPARPPGPARVSTGDDLIIVPVRGFVLFPGVVLPSSVGRPRSIAAAQQAVREGRQIGILAQREAEIEDPAPQDLHRIGVVANLLRYVTTPDGIPPSDLPG